MAPRARLAGGQAGRVREEDLTGKKMAEKKNKKWGKKEKMLTGGPLMAYLGNMLFYSFRLRCLFCTINFSTRKHEFDRVSSVFSVCVFTDSVRDALSSAGGN
jgi:hypothetical protein